MLCIVRSFCYYLHIYNEFVLISFSGLSGTAKTRCNTTQSEERTSTVRQFKLILIMRGVRDNKCLIRPQSPEVTQRREQQCMNSMKKDSK